MNYAELKHKISFLEYNTVCMNECNFFLISVNILYVCLYIYF